MLSSITAPNRILSLWIVLTLLRQQNSISFQFVPSRISFHHVSQSYPDTLLRKLLSSTPRRDLALNNISFCFESNSFHVIVGASSSGKSTILRLLNGMETPISGHVKVESTSIPIYLEGKPAYHHNSRQAIDGILRQHYNDKSIRIGLEIANILSLNVTKRPIDLSSSELYKFGLLDACLKSVISEEGEDVCGPILLLDEWLDRETSSVTHKVEEAIVALTMQIGAIVLYVTHKPNMLKGSHKCITMCRGEILSVGRTKWWY